MSCDLINPNIVPLFQGLKPYLGDNGRVLTDGVLSVLQLVTSQHGQDAVHLLNKVLMFPGKSDKTVTINTAAGPFTFSLGSAFSLFLILILLILSGNLLAINNLNMDNVVEEPVGMDYEGIGV